MGKPYSLDLRKRVVAAIEGGMSRNRAAKQFGVAISTAIGWMRRVEETGSVEPGQMGGHKPKAISGEHAVWLSQRIRDGDFTIRGLVAELGGARPEGRLPLGVGLRACREAQLQKKAWRLASAIVPTWRGGAPSGQSIKIASKPERLVFIDETWTRTDMAPLRGWAPRGTQAHDQGSPRPLEDDDVPGGAAP